MQNFYGIKEFYDVTLRALHPIQIGDKHFNEGEVVLSFDNIQIAQISENKTMTAAKGGKNNTPLVFWEDTTKTNLTFTSGIFSLDQLSLISNSIQKTENEKSILIHRTEIIESDENGYVSLKIPLENTVDCRFYDTLGQPIEVRDNIGTAFLTIRAEYDFVYTSNFTTIQIGERITNNFFHLQGKTKLKQDSTGMVLTGIIDIPKFKIQSALTLTLGKNNIPSVNTFSGSGYPTNKSDVCANFYVLSEDIDSDIGGDF